MFRSGRTEWRKLDNAALAFPAATGAKDTRVFRFYCELKETVDAALLQQALDRTMEAYPVFQAVLRKGLFWFYLEPRRLRAMAAEEKRPPCSTIYVPDQKKLLFEVTYYKNRINFEVFHGLTDGTGATQFLRELVKNYLRLAHADVLPEVSLQEESLTFSDQEEDSFSQYYSPKQQAGKKKGVRAHQLSGQKLDRDHMEITECRLSVQEVLEKSRSLGVSMTVYLSAVLLFSIHQELTERQERRPVTLMIPINLRNYFPSHSMANFFGWMEIGCRFRRETTFEEVLESVKEQFETELSKERIAERMNDLIRLEKNPFLRIVPLELKNVFLQAGTSLGAKNITAIFSNMSIVRMPKDYEPYIERFGVYTSTDKLQLCACSFRDELALGFTSKLVSVNIQRNFLELLKAQGIGSEIKTPMYPEKKESKGGAFFRWFTFLCIAAVVIAAMANGIFTPDGCWWIFAAGGAASCWCGVAIGYYKRRNLLKNSMWQLLTVSAVCMLWDAATGWRGWSVDYVVPLASLLVLVTVSVIAKLRQLDTVEYLFYQVMAAGFGLIPGLLLLLGAVRVRYPSILCAGCSLLFLVFAGIFRGRELSGELQKKFHI